MREIAIIGCGFVADLYMRSFATFPKLRIAGVFDLDPDRLTAFCGHWILPAFETREALFAAFRARPES